MKRVQVAYATRARQYLWTVELADAASVADALAAARAAAGETGGVPWDSAAVGIFGEPCAREARCAHGDRIELYRPLAADPRAARRARVAQERRARTRR